VVDFAFVDDKDKDEAVALALRAGGADDLRPFALAAPALCLVALT
jgi:hypothetical protein